MYHVLCIVLCGLTETCICSVVYVLCVSLRGDRSCVWVM